MCLFSSTIKKGKTTAITLNKKKNRKAKSTKHQTIQKKTQMNRTQKSSKTETQQKRTFFPLNLAICVCQKKKNRVFITLLWLNDAARKQKKTHNNTAWAFRWSALFFFMPCRLFLSLPQFYNYISICWRGCLLVISHAREECLFFLLFLHVPPTFSHFAVFQDDGLWFFPI